MNKNTDYENKMGGTKIMASVTRHRDARKAADGDLHEKYDGMSNEELIRAYKKGGLPSKERKWLLDEIYIRIFFLFPYTLKQHCYYLKASVFDETLQNLSLKFLEALRLFDPDKGFSFTNYFTGYMYSGIKKTFKESNLVKMPDKKKGSIAEEAPAFEDDVPEGDVPEEPEAEEAVQVDEYVGDPERGMSEDGLLITPVSRNPDISADRVYSCTAVTLIEGLQGEEIDIANEVYRKELQEWVEEALSPEAGVLTEDERRVVIAHNGLFDTRPMYYRQIAELRGKEGKGTTRSRISQIHTSAVAKLKEWFRKNRILDGEKVTD